MVGAGNDFIMIDPDPSLDYVDLAVRVCDRHNGIGADGLIVVDESDSSDYRMRIFNADGSEAEMCGNGARCFASYVVANRQPSKDLFSVETIAGQLKAESKDEISNVQLSDPVDYRPDIELNVGGQTLHAHSIDTGVPHAIIFVEKLHEIDVDSLGRTIRNHQAFKPRGTNVNFVEFVKPGMVELRTYERGVEGETLACGTGAVASALMGFLHANPNVKEQKGASMKVLTASKEILDVKFDLAKDVKITNVWLKGSGKFIARGEYYYS